MNNIKKIIFFILVVVITYACNTNADKVTFKSLLLEITDRDAMARFPLPEYSCKQFSSYDRASVAPDKPGWFGNWDRSQFIRTEKNAERTEYVMFDAEGPGAVVRFWMTFAGFDGGKGILRIYFDRDSIPEIEGPAMTLLSGGILAGKPLSASVSELTEYEKRGHNLYLPLPYAKHCKITYESDHIEGYVETRGEAVFYNIVYRTYPIHTQVITFSKDILRKEQKALERVQWELTDATKGFAELKTTSSELTGKIKPNDHIATEIKGNKAIRRIRFKVSANNLEQALRSTILLISFDRDTNKPDDLFDSNNVCCPLGDFFGTGYQIRPSETRYTSVAVDGTLTAYWVMPFSKNCTFRVYNMGDQEVEITTGEIIYSSWQWDNRSMYFGSSWHQYTNILTREIKPTGEEGGPFDINFVTLKGKGVYVGDALTLFNTANEKNDWWGEGDEKIFIDGESFPSHFGTGSEDYFGYAWGLPAIFNNHPFIAQPDGSGNLEPGYTVNLRFRALDRIPFHTSIQFDMELWHWIRTRINYAPATFYYTTTNLIENKIDMDGIKAPVALKREDIIKE
jgi:hypothetical protein